MKEVKNVLFFKVCVISKDKIFFNIMYWSCLRKRYFILRLDMINI